jgi:hypothetical protein
LAKYWRDLHRYSLFCSQGGRKANAKPIPSNAMCSITGADEWGTLQSTNCDVGQGNVGCGVLSNSSSSYGTGFNNIKGGVYATEWTSSYIKVWFFPRAAIPQDIENGRPVPSSWGKPQANLAGNCDIDSHFSNHEIIFDTTFCGDWAGSVWKLDSVCNSSANTCNEYVAQNPSVYSEA